MWVSSPLPGDSLETLIVRLWGKPETRFGVFTKDAFSFHGALYAPPAQARKKVGLCFVSQAARVFSASCEGSAEISGASFAYYKKQDDNPQIEQGIIQNQRSTKSHTN